ncbi:MULTISPECIES: SLC13 family permease [unclassified Campylobacter]|uniref:SLC13 family permease n=1 Tax=unclassified Campylobacter TaxID=2593542 RepID=UPI001237EA67|nr:MULTISPECIES: DASS family sodium-coupled anion symporter [unclassified Campylobacter]KAA6225382.1 DASS family sodium-coupled anion symporter [Campylobacter sp. LR185c]KAA6227078.1 DASS family sodium-coupled anion symporter [Campylobacter sp. LR196d]KAA6228704.1 DASS family sodium-coupled anion symporter [Campylobacter sp. LR286c]KAA6229514.1 DASS family sodium-coupled anion symporter [Campylobacter sp. LR264d]KAA6230758.1 DASS family sodium-coupled anion symporter [Campylobacter sp. LR291e]
MSRSIRISIIIVDILLFIALLYLLPFETKVNQGLAILVFIAVLWLSEAVHTTITAILIPILAACTGLLTTKVALAGFADPNIFIFFGGFALAAAMHYQELDKIIAQRILLLARGHFALSLLYMFIITAFLSMWISNTATAAMMLPLAIGMLSNVKFEENKSTYVFTLLGIAFSASIGGIGTLVGTPPNLIVATNLNINFSQWLQYGIPMVLVLMPLMLIVLFIVFRPNLKQKVGGTLDIIPMNKQRYITLAIFAFTALCWIFSSYLSPLVASLINMKKIASFDSVIAIFAAVLVCIFGVIDWKKVEKNTEWGVLMLFGGGITLSLILKDSGASKVMADGLIWAIQGGHLFLIGLAISFFIVLLTEFTSNTASAALLVPLFISIAESLGAPPLGLALIIAIGASCAFMLPVATPPNAIVFGTGYIKQSEMVRVGIILNICCSVIIAIAAYFFWL